MSVILCRVCAKRYEQETNFALCPHDEKRAASRRRFIYMNEKVREAEPSGPVIVVQTGARLKSTNLVRLLVGGVVVAEVRFLPGGLQEAPQHHVRAFVELFDGVEVKVS